MQKLIFINVVFFFSVNLFAQAKKTFTVDPGQKIADAIPVTEIYSYPEFRIGTVALRNGTAVNAKLNYNSVFGEMQFIDPKNGDTISLAEEKNIKFVAVEKDTFYFDEGWLQVINTDTLMKMAKKKLLGMINIEKIGAMGIVGAGSIETYTKLSTRQGMKDLVAKEKLTLAENITYYFGDRFNHFSKANKKNLLNLHRGREEKIETWLKENKIDFNKGDDLKKLFVFLNEL